MVKAIWQYSRDEVLPRWRRILLQPQVACAVALAVATYLQAAEWPVAKLKVSEITTMLLTYAAIAFGFCISGMALVLTIPSTNFVQLLMKHQLPGQKQNSYSDLLFLFSWTGVVHWLVVVLAIVAVCFRSNDSDLVRATDGPAWKSLVGVLAGGSAYALVQFLLTVITLSAVGRLYIRESQRS